MISTDPSQNTLGSPDRLQRFNPRTFVAVDGPIERLADEIIQRAQENGTGDFIIDVAAPFPSRSSAPCGRASPASTPGVEVPNIILSNGDLSSFPEARTRSSLSRSRRDL